MFSVKKSNIFQLILVITMLLGSMFLGVFQVIFEGLTQIKFDLNGILGVSLVQVVLVFLPFVIYILASKGFVKNSLYLKSPGIFNVILSVLLMIVLIPTVGLINYVSQFFVQNHIEGTINSMSQFPYPLVILVTAVFPGIFEELQTRYLILNHYRYKPYYITCIMSGLFFGMMHLNINQFLYAFFLGVIFAYLLQVTGSLFISIIMHFCLNAFSVTVSYFSNGAQAAATEVANLPTLFAILGVNIVTIPIALLILWKITQYNGKLAILKQKPTTLELTLGKKIEPYTPMEFQDNNGFSPYQPAPQNAPYQPNYQASPYQPNPASPQPMPVMAELQGQAPQANQWYQAGQTISGPESYEIYAAKSHNAFNWAFWAYVILFVGISILNEASKNLIQ